MGVVYFEPFFGIVCTICYKNSFNPSKLKRCQGFIFILPSGRTCFIKFVYLVF